MRSPLPKKKAARYSTNTGLAGSHSKSERFSRRRKGEHKTRADGGDEGKGRGRRAVLYPYGRKRHHQRPTYVRLGWETGSLFFLSSFPFYCLVTVRRSRNGHWPGGVAPVLRDPGNMGVRSWRWGGVVPARRELLSFCSQDVREKEEGKVCSDVSS